MMPDNQVDNIVGGAAAIGGPTFIWLHLSIQFGSLVLVILNTVLAVGGLYLLYLRVRKARKEK